jgi:amino acid transporter
MVAVFNNISVWWHVAGVAVIVAILVIAPDRHQSFSFVFTETINNSGFGDGGMFWLYVLPLGFLLTQYTITGFDASAHISEETHGAAETAPKGVWRSVFYSALIGWIVLLAITFAVGDPGAVTEAGGTSLAIFDQSLSATAAEIVILISCIGQLFCGMACVTSASRMTYAFSRDRAIPGWRIWTKLDSKRVPIGAVLFVCFWALVITIPALWSNAAGIPVAFFAVVSVCVIGLYIAYAIPIYLRWRMGDAFKPGPWTNGRKYRWMNLAATIWVGIITVIFCLPFTPAAVPWNDEFDWNAVNYAPLTVGGVLLAVGIWWLVSARHSFTGPVRTIEFAGEGLGVADAEPEKV